MTGCPSTSVSTSASHNLPSSGRNPREREREREKEREREREARGQCKLDIVHHEPKELSHTGQVVKSAWQRTNAWHLTFSSFSSSPTSPNLRRPRHVEDGKSEQEKQHWHRGLDFFSPPSSHSQPVVRDFRFWQSSPEHLQGAGGLSWVIRDGGG